jgi:hypothetical protein
MFSLPDAIRAAGLDSMQFKWMRGNEKGTCQYFCKMFLWTIILQV